MCKANLSYIPSVWFVNSHNPVNSKQMFTRTCRCTFPQQEVFPCQAASLDMSSSGSGSVKKEKVATVFVLLSSFSVKETCFTLLYHSVLKIGKFKFKEKQQACGTRSDLENFLKVWSLGKWRASEIRALRLYCSDCFLQWKIDFQQTFLKHTTNFENVRKSMDFTSFI